MTEIAAYGAARQAAGPGTLREESPSFRGSELEWQARLFNGEFGTRWQGEDGEEVEIRHFGAWNREPGPDFCGALVLIDGQELKGDIELDPEAGDWEHHGHARNEAFENVVLHIFFRRTKRRFFTRTLQNRSIVQICLPVAGKRPASSPASSYELGADEALRLIEAAAKFRLHRKHEAMQRSIHLWGGEQALFQSLATALGYKHNKVPFLLLAERSGWKRARSEEGEALLFGLAGFLDARRFESADAPARDYLRNLWETWWRLRDREARLVLSADSWKLAALRPANHPHRRLGALAAITHVLPRLRKAVEEASMADFRETLAGLSHPFWDRHFNLQCGTLKGTIALIGNDRLVDIVVNAFLPSLPLPKAWRHLVSLPGPTPSRKVTLATDWLGGKGKLSYFRSSMHQQGLIQLWDDFSNENPMDILKVIASKLS